MAVTVPDPPANGEYVLMACNGSVFWADRSSVRGPAGPPGERGPVGPAGKQGPAGKDAPNFNINLTTDQ